MSATSIERIDTKHSYVDELQDPSTTTVSVEYIGAARPPIDYSSLSAFFPSFWRRFKSIWTKRFILSLLFGQITSLCITCTNVTTTELVNRNWSLPTTQNFFL